MRRKNGGAAAKRYSRAGFTLSEVLLVMAIMLSLFAVTAANAPKVVRNARQASLDRMAEEIYVTASRNLLTAEITGTASELEKAEDITTAFNQSTLGSTLLESYEAQKLSLTVNNANGTPPETAGLAYKVYKLASGGVSAAANVLLPAGSLSEEYRDGGWYIAYTVQINDAGEYSCSVAEVFCTTAEYKNTDEWKAIVEKEDYRKDYRGAANAARRATEGKARFGYYAGDKGPVPALPKTETIDPGEFATGLEVRNEEELSVIVYAKLPKSREYFSDAGKESPTYTNPRSVKFTLMIAGQTSHATATLTETVNSASSFDYGDATPFNCWVNSGTNTYYYRFVLDSLNGSDQFSRFAELTAGEDIIVSVEAECSYDDNGTTVTNKAVPVEEAVPDGLGGGGFVSSGFVNSLFGSRVSTRAFDQVEVKYGRHLQNLDADAVGKDLRAVQVADIDFADSSRSYYQNWKDVYGDKKTFKPIDNDKVQWYDGSGHSISNLTATAESGKNAGLFGTFSGTMLRGITLVDPQIKGAGSTVSTGGLAGETTVAATVSNCALYMTDAQYNGKTATEVQEIWLVGGGNAGGLVGHAGNTLGIVNSYAATVVKTTNGTAGGLVGKAEMALVVSGSYADCYVSGKTVGGLAGSCGAESKFENCYSAGFLLGNSNTTTAGGFAGSGSVALSGTNISLFNFDDVTKFTDNTEANAIKVVGGYVTEYPEYDNKLAHKYAFAPTVSGDTNTALYCYGDAEGGGVYKSVKDMNLGTAEQKWYQLATSAVNAQMIKQTKVKFVDGLDQYGDWLERPQSAGLWARVYSVQEEGKDSYLALYFETGAPKTKSEDGKITYTLQDSTATGTDAGANGKAQWRGWTGLTNFYQQGFLERLWFPWRNNTDGFSRQIKKVVFEDKFVQDEKAKPVNIASWFSDFSTLEECQNIGELDTSKATTMYCTFYGCAALTTLDVSKWDTSEVTNMYSTFYNCSALTPLDVSGWNTSKVTTMYCTFSGCSALTTLGEQNVSKWNTENVTTMYSTFSGCSKLTELDVSAWDTSKVSDMASTFSGCSALTTLGEQNVSNWNTSNVTTMYGTFNGCKSLTSLDVSKWDTSKVTTMSYTFADCSALTTLGEQNVSKWNTGEVTTMTSTFFNCSKLTPLDVSKWNTSNVTTMYCTFYGCSALTSLGEQNVSKWNTEKVTTMYCTFYGCSALTPLNVSGWNTSNVTTMYGTFSDCAKLTELDVSNWDTGKVSSVESTFKGCSALTTLGEQNVSNWNTGEVTTMASTFYGCSKLEMLDVSGWDTSKVTNCRSMFYNMSSLTTIYASDKFVVSQIGTQTGTDGAETDLSGNMFFGCTKLEGGNGTKYSGAKTDRTYAWIDGRPGNTADSNSARGYFTAKVTYTVNIVDAEDEATPLDTKTYTTDYKGDSGERVTGTTGNPMFADLSYSAYYVYKVAEEPDKDDPVTLASDTTVKQYIEQYPGRLVQNDTSKLEYVITVYAEVPNVIYGVLKDGVLTFQAEKPSTGIEGTDWFTLDGNKAYQTYTALPWYNDYKNDITEIVMTVPFKPGETRYWFQGLSNVKVIDISGLDTSNVKFMTNMFQGCSSLEKIYVSDKFVIPSAVTANTSMFGNCSTNLKGGNGTTWNSANYGISYARIDGGPDSENPGYFTDIADKPKPSVIVGNILIIGAEDIPKLTATVTGNAWDNSLRTRLELNAEEAQSISHIDLSGLPSYFKPTSMKYWFFNFANLKSVDFGSLDTSAVTDMSYMFYYCEALETIYVDTNFSTEAVTSSGSMFLMCTNLKGGSGTTYSQIKSQTNETTASSITYARIDGGPSSSTPGYFTAKSSTSRAAAPARQSAPAPASAPVSHDETAEAEALVPIEPAPDADVTPDAAELETESAGEAESAPDAETEIPAPDAETLELDYDDRSFAAPVDPDAAREVRAGGIVIGTAALTADGPAFAAADGTPIDSAPLAYDAESGVFLVAADGESAELENVTQIWDVIKTGEDLAVGDPSLYYFFPVSVANEETEETKFLLLSRVYEGFTHIGYNAYLCDSLDELDADGERLVFTADANGAVSYGTDGAPAPLTALALLPAAMLRPVAARGGRRLAKRGGAPKRRGGKRLMK